MAAAALIAGAVAAGFGVRAWTRARTAASVRRCALAGRPPAVAAHLRGAHEAASARRGRLRLSALCAPRITPTCCSTLRAAATTGCGHSTAMALGLRARAHRYRTGRHPGTGRPSAGHRRPVRRSSGRCGCAWATPSSRPGVTTRPPRRGRRAAQLPEPDAEAAATPPHVPEASMASHAAFGLARVALVRGDAASARHILERLVRVSPGFGPALRLLGGERPGLGLDADRPGRSSAPDVPAFAPFVVPFVDGSPASHATARCCCGWRRKRRWR